MMMMMMAGFDNHHRPFTSYCDIDGDGPTTGNNNNRPNNNNIYDDVLGSSDFGSGVVGSSSSSGGSVGVRFVQQPFSISTSTAHLNAYKSPGGIMAASLEFPFTFSQYKELERQVMIFKYMKASIPVPIDLLMPINGIPSLAVNGGGGGGLNLRFSGGRGDFEPGRCKRTDGKKWRCSRDVAPDQKYCERHLHRGRPRSRKPVELPNKKTRHSQNQALPSSSSSAVFTKNAPQPQIFGSLAQPCFVDKPSEKAATTFWPLTTSVSRTSDWTMNELIPLADQQWNHLMQLGTATTTEGSFSNYDKEPLNLIPCLNFNASADEQRNGCPWFLNSEIVPLQKSPESTPKGFIDAWSAGVSDESPVSCNGKLSVSSLSLSMGINNNISDDEMGLIHMGLGVSEYDHHNHEFASKSDLSSWLSPASWAGSTPGGPLAEVLRSSTTVSSSNPSSPVTGNGNCCSPAVTAVSSPSGVLQKALASFSDSSGSSSPTFVSSMVKPEIGLMLG